MSEPYSKLTSYIVLVLMVTIMPIMILSLFMNHTYEMAAKAEITEFVNTCEQTGRIDPAEYRNLYKNLGTLGNYHITMSIKQLVAFPNGAGGFEYRTIDLGDNEITELLFGTNEKPEDTILYMNSGDQITVTLSGYALSTASNLLNVMCGTDINKIIIKDSGVVGEAKTFD